MPFNGSGTFSRLYSWVVDAANNVNISSSRTDAEMNGFAAALTNCVTRDGQSPPSADLPMGGKKLLNLGNATTATDALNMATGDTRYLLASGATNLTLSGTLTAVTMAISGNGTIGGALSVTGQVAVTNNIIIGSNAGPGNNVYLNGASGTARGIGFQSAGVYAADITLQTDNVTIAYKAATAHTFYISGSQVASFSSTGLNVPGTLAVGGAILTVNTNLLVQFDGTNGFFRTQSGALNLGAGGSNYLNISASGAISQIGTGTVTFSGQTNLANVTGTPNGTAANSLGFLGLPSIIKTANYSIVQGDIGQSIDFNGTTLTCTLGALADGFICGISNISASPLTITSGTSTLIWSGTTTTGNRTLGQNGEARIHKKNGVIYISGTALS